MYLQQILTGFGQCSEVFRELFLGLGDEFVGVGFPEHLL